MAIPTEPIGSIPRPISLINARRAFEAGAISEAELHAACDDALRDTVQRFESTGSPVITDGEQAKHSFVTYPLHGLENIAADGMPILFTDGHVRHLPRLKAGPFGYRTPADVYLEEARRYTRLPLKQAVISASALSLLYPQGGVPGYSREEYFETLLDEQEREIRRCLQKGAHVVQIDFTEGRLSTKLDPTGRLLRSFLDLNNLVLERFSAEEQKRIGVHTCPGADRGSTHSAGSGYGALLSELFDLRAGNFYVQLASESDRRGVLKIIREHARPDQRVFVGVVDVLDPVVELPETIRDRVLEAAEFVPIAQLGTTDDCGFAPFSDDVSRSRETAFAKVRARVLGTQLAEKALGVA